MEHGFFFTLMTIPLLMLLAFDRKNFRTYLLLGLFAVLCGTVFENITTWMGFWTHLTGPRAGLTSVWNAALYFHYVCFSWFIGERLRERFA